MKFGAAIGGLADLTYNSVLIEQGVAAGGFEEKAGAAQVKDTLEDALIGSTLVVFFVRVTDMLPANVMGFAPSNFMVVLEALELRIDG